MSVGTAERVVLGTNGPNFSTDEDAGGAAGWSDTGDRDEAEDGVQCDGSGIASIPLDRFGVAR